MHKKIILLLIYMFVPIITWAYQFRDGCITYEILSQSEYQVAVTSGGTSRYYNGEIIIPETVTHRGHIYDVVGITSQAFKGSDSITSITIPPSVVFIGDSAFLGCTGLKYMIISDSDKPLKLGCNKYTGVTAGQAIFHDSPLETVYIGRELLYETGFFYGYSPFYKKNKLTFVVVGDCVQEIESRAFYGCGDLQSITIGAAVKKVGNYAFFGCKSLNELTIKEGELPLEIGVNGQKQNLFYDAPVENLYLGRTLLYNESSLPSNNPFRKKETLRMLTIGDSVVHISPYMFAGCSSIKSLTIKGGVRSIGNGAFEGCTMLQELYFSDADSILVVGCNKHENSTMGQGLFHDSPLRTLYLGRTLDFSTSYFDGYSPFYNSARLEVVTIGEKVRHLGDRLFWGCKHLSTVTIGGRVEAVGNYVFKECEKLSRVVFCDGATPLYLGYNKVMKGGIGQSIFSDCRLQSLYIGRSLTYNVSRFYGFSPFYKQESLSSVSLTSSVSYLAQNLFYGCSSLTALTIPSSVETIENNVFIGTSLQSITIEDASATLNLGYNLLSVNENCGLFHELPLKHLYIGRPTHFTRHAAFAFLPNLESVEIGGGVKAISDEMFLDCVALQSLTIGEAVEYVGNCFVKGCVSLSQVLFSDGDLPLILGYNEYKPGGVGRSLFYGNPIRTLYIGRELRYPDTLPYGYSPFYRMNSLIDVTIGKTVTSVGPRLFYGCKNLEKLSIEGVLTQTGIYAFYGCPATKK